MVNFEIFESHPIICGASTRRTERGDFLRELGIEKSSLARLEQVHKGKVVKIGKKTVLSKEISGCDAAVTDVKGIALSVRTADCLPIFLYDPLNGAIGIAHAGWRSTKERLAGNTVEAMNENFKSEPSRMIIGLGPAIRQCCYEVNSEFLVHFPDSVVKMAHRYYFDLVGENVEQLISCGVLSKNIYDCGVCTSCRNDEFYSYRREKDKAGRILSVIMLK